MADKSKEKRSKEEKKKEKAEKKALKKEAKAKAKLEKKKALLLLRRTEKKYFAPGKRRCCYGLERIFGSREEQKISAPAKSKTQC